MKYAEKNVYIKSNWFDSGNNTYKKIGYRGFYLYLNLFKFLVRYQEYDYTFITSIQLLKKELGNCYSTQEVYELIRLLVKHKVIGTNISRWDRMFDADGKIIDDRTIIIYGVDKPNTNRVIENGEEKDQPETEDDYYIKVNLDTIQHYIDVGLNERSCGLYCVLKKQSNNVEAKSWLTVNEMADILGFGDNYINNLIHEMNRKYLLASVYRKCNKNVVSNGKKKKGKRWEHHLLYQIKYQEDWLKTYKVYIDKNIKMWDGKSEKDGLFCEDEEDE